MAASRPVVSDAAAAVPRAASPDDRSGLAARAAGGDQVAFAALYRLSVDRTFRYLRLRVGDDAQAADLTQDVWLRALGGIGELSEPARFDAWLFAITRNRLRRHWEGERRRPAPVSLDARREGSDVGAVRDNVGVGHAMVASVDGVSPIDPVDPVDAIEGTTELAGAWHRAALVAAVAALSDRQREVIALRFGAGYGVQETAALLGRSEAAVKQLQHRALVALRAVLHDGETT